MHSARANWSLLALATIGAIGPRSTSSTYTTQYGAVGPYFAKTAGRFGPKAAQTRSLYHVASSRACSVANIPSIFGALRAAMRLLDVFLKDPCCDRQLQGILRASSSIRW
jgi:hypothetical protein